MKDLLREVAALAVQSAGLDLSAIPRHSLSQALGARLRVTQRANTVAYMALLQESAQERAEFLEEVLVPETFFFRDTGAFTEMVRWCLEWYAAHTGVLRILSAPCSTGEEPYSLAAMLWNAGVDPELFVVEAADISSRSLERARAAIYGSLSLRSFPNGQTPAFLEQTPRGWQVREPVRRRVRFRQLNLVEPKPGGASLLAEDGLFDLICSRNLLLYQTPAARRELARSVRALLAPGGRLVIGAADWCSELAQHFTFSGPPSAFALRARDAEESAPVALATPAPALGGAVPKSALDRKGPLSERGGTPPASALQRPQPRQPSRRAMPEPPDPEMKAVHRLHASSLAALSEGRQGDAERLCRQALYLDGSHVPSLELLSRLWSPAGPERMRRALEVRLARHRGAADSPEDASHAS